MTVLLIMVAVTTSLFAQERPSGGPTAAIPALIRDMTGTWSVEQRMWTGPGAGPAVLPSAIARRRLLEGGFLEEVMEKSPRVQGDTFTRIAYLNFNAVTQRFEYVSLDSRAPQLMVERSRGPEAGGDHGSAATLVVFGEDIFVAPQWGDAKNAAFRYRLTIGAIEKDRHVVQLYLTPVRPEHSVEFLAFEYVYTRKKP